MGLEWLQRSLHNQQAALAPHAKGSLAGTDLLDTRESSETDTAAARPQRCRMDGDRGPESAAKVLPPPHALPHAAATSGQALRGHSGERGRRDRQKGQRTGRGRAGDSKGRETVTPPTAPPLPFPSTSAGARAASPPSQRVTHSFRLA